MHIVLTTNQHVFEFTTKYYVCGRKATNINFIAFPLTQWGTEPTSLAYPLHLRWDIRNQQFAAIFLCPLQCTEPGP